MGGRGLGKSHVCAAMSRMNRGGLPQSGREGHRFLSRQEEEEKKRKKMEKRIFPAIFVSLLHNLRSTHQRLTGGRFVIMLPQSIISSTSRGGAVSEI